MKNLFTILVLLFAAGTTYAQSQITGKITSETGETLVGATVQLYETKQGSTTDLDGVCLLYTSPSPRDLSTSRMPSSA